MWNEGSVKDMDLWYLREVLCATEELSSTKENSVLCVGIIKHMVLGVTKV